MDPEARAAIRAIVADLRDAGVAILLTSHDLTDVERLADRIVVIDSGRVVADGTAAELAAGARSTLRVRLDGPLAPDELAALGTALAAGRGGITVAADGDGARYRVDGAAPDADLVAALATWCASAGRLIVELRTGGGSLEDVYLGLVGRAAAEGGDAVADGTART
jgi:ABC-2 type transport system ATP-binding protein